MFIWLPRLLCLTGFTVVVLMLGYYATVHHGASAEAVEAARFNLIQTMLIYVAGCVMLFIAGVPQLLWKFDRHASWQKIYLVGLVASFPGIGLGLMLLVSQLPK